MHCELLQRKLPKNGSMDQGINCRWRNARKGHSEPARRGKRCIPMKSDLLDWLRVKIAEAETAVRTREQMASTWLTGTDKSWAIAASMHPSTSGKPTMNKAERLKVAAAQDRIAAECRLDLEMFRAAFDAISKLTLAVDEGASHF